MAITRVLVTLATTFVLLLLGSPQPALADEAASQLPAAATMPPVAATEPQSAATITKNYTYDARYAPPDIPQQTEDADGVRYSLSSVSEPRPASGVQHYRSYSASVQKAIPDQVYQAGDAAIREALGNQYLINQNGFYGNIPLQDYTAQVYWRTEERLVDRLLTYTNLPSEDTVHLPNSAQFEVSSNSAPGATQTVSLQRVAINWQIAGYAADGRPNNFTAVVTFRGLEQELVVDYWLIQASYSGVVPALAQMVTVQASYDQVVAIVPVQPAVQTPHIEPDVVAVPVVTPAAQTSVGWLPAIIAAFVVVILLVLLPLLLFLTRNARLVRTDAQGRLRTVLRRRLQVQNGSAAFVIPANIQLFASNTRWHIALSGRLAAQTAVLRVIWGDRLVLRTPLTTHIDLQEALVRGIQFGLNELALEESTELLTDTAYHAQTNQLAREGE